MNYSRRPETRAFANRKLFSSCEKSKAVSLISSIMKNIVAFPNHSRFPVKLIYHLTCGTV